MDVDIASLPLVGGHPALDLVNTVTPRVAVRGVLPHDHLTDPPALLVWGRRAELLDESEARAVAQAWRADPGAAHAALDAVREIRDALHEILLAAIGEAAADPAVTGRALDRMTGRWAAAAARSRLTLDPAADPVIRLWMGVAPIQLIPDRAADAAVSLLRAAEFDRLRRCPLADGGCGWLFLDRSRNGSRRWCRMADCGTEVKARRLTERRRDARSVNRQN